MAMVDLWLKDVLLDGKPVQVTVRGNRFASVGDAPPAEGARHIIDGGGRTAILPPFYNMHTHSAMTLLRGYAIYDWGVARPEGLALGYAKPDETAIATAA